MRFNKPTIIFKRNKNIQNLIGSHLIMDGKISKDKLEIRQSKSKTCKTPYQLYFYAGGKY